MKRSEYLWRAAEAYNEGRISEEVYDSMVMNADVFCDEGEGEYGLPSTTLKWSMTILKIRKQ